jgi:hypothetical protein
MPSCNRGRILRFGAPTPDLHLRSRFSTKIQSHPCQNPEIRRLLPELFRGNLIGAHYKSDRRRLEQHIRKCRRCQDICIEQAHRSVTLPFLSAVAKDMGLTTDELLQALQDVAARISAAGSRART